jgi:hypothetical protein
MLNTRKAVAAETAGEGEQMPRLVVLDAGIEEVLPLPLDRVLEILEQTGLIGKSGLSAPLLHPIGVYSVTFGLLESAYTVVRAEGRWQYANMLRPRISGALKLGIPAQLC